jgi:murein DD-endopeptidase MepM/ murein hydrolase activator NlpD
MPRFTLPVAAGAAAVALAMAGAAAIAVPSYASALEQAQYAAASQHLDLAAHADPITVAPRDGVTVTTFTPVQWPIDPATEISSPFGPRVAPCGGCSTMHRGVDLVPGAGTPIAAIADGTVVEAGFFGELGEHVMVQHDVDGETVTSVYGHMIGGSMHLAVGDRVTRGQLLGLVGSTGESTGAHLHFGILDAAQTPEDPMAWMRAHVTQPWATTPQ